MSYKALYRKYRPNGFEDVVGQKHITSTLINIIEKNKVGHAYLFSGPRGTGKTSIAKIFAKSINCYDYNTTNKWEYCSTIMDDHFAIDIVEIDAASNNGVNEIRQMIDNSSYATTKSKYKVYIIDEVHMLTKGAFNALLKTLEEPPEHVVFVLATTESHKLPATVLSRLQRFNFTRISNNDIVKRIEKILKLEKIKSDEKSLQLIAKMANGGLRDALTIIDQIAAFGNSEITYDLVLEMFGIVDNEMQVQLLNSAAASDMKSLLEITRTMIDSGKDLQLLTTNLLTTLKEWIIYYNTSDENLLNYITLDNYDELSITKNFAYNATDILLKLHDDLKFSDVAHQLFEVIMIKIASLKDNARFISDSQEAKPANESDDGRLFNTIDLSLTETYSSIKPKVVVKDDLPKEPPVKKIPKTNPFDITTEMLLSSDEEEFDNSVIVKKHLVDAKDIAYQSTLDNIGERKPDSHVTGNTETIDIRANHEPVEISHTMEVNTVNQHNNTEDINIEKLFTAKNKKNKKHASNKKIMAYGMNEIINLLLQQEKTFRIKYKQLWSKFDAYKFDVDLSHFASLMNSVSVISAGKNWIIVGSELDSIVDELNETRQEKAFLKMLKKVFGNKIVLFAITKHAFSMVKHEWKQLESKKKLPKVVKFEPKFDYNYESDSENYGANLFGDVFKKGD